MTRLLRKRLDAMEAELSKREVFIGVTAAKIIARHMQIYARAVPRKKRRAQ